MQPAAPRGAPRLDESSFKNFAPLLEASQAYAQMSGCRFRNASFDGLPDAAQAMAGAPLEVTTMRATDSGPRLAAKLRASPTVAEFAERLREGEEGLVEELERAFRIVMVESVRNAMIGMFQALDLFPPSPAPAAVNAEDCSYEDVTAPLPVVAQRLYNDQKRRSRGRDDGDGFAGRLHRRALTASFIVDFASVHCIPLPPISDTHQSMLRELSERVEEASKCHKGPESEQSRARAAFMKNLGAGTVAEALRLEMKKSWVQNWRNIATLAVMLGVVGAGFMSVKPRRLR